MITTQIAFRMLVVLGLFGCACFATTAIPPDTSKITASLEADHG